MNHHRRTLAVLLLALLLLAGCTGAELAPIVAPPLTPTSAVAVEPTATQPPTAEATPTAAVPTAAPIAEPAVFDPQLASLDLQPVADGLNQPLFATHAGDGSGRLFIVEKPGRIRILTDGQVLDVPFLDISARVDDGANERGLLGLAFSPTYGDTGHFFVNYSDRAGNTQVSRFSVSADDPNLADAASEFSVLNIAQPASNHNGGMLAFGPDGMLYIGTGDGGAANDRFGNGQNPATLLGKMLRLDVTSDPSQPYLIPSDNPWVVVDWNGIDVRDEIWGVGLRNPWRYSFDRLTGDLWIGDVGQNQYEEVDFIPAGTPGPLNFGWPLMEADQCFNASNCDATGLELPVATYSHAGHCSVTGGYVYRGQAYPALTGAYFYGDYCSGVIWALARAGDGAWVSTQLLDASLSLSSFAEDEAGELYVTDLAGGTIYRLVGGGG